MSRSYPEQFRFSPALCSIFADKSELICEATPAVFKVSFLIKAEFGAE